jgi:alpha-glucosidase
VAAAKGRLPRDPVLYEIYVRSFSDSDGDGVGDIRGITSRLDYLAALGVDGIWLTPIFASPQFDFGYDVSDYRAVHGEYGTVADVDELIDQAHRHGIAVVLDMVLAHTSIRHPWFRGNPERYVWAERRPNNWLSVFGGSAWTWHPERGRYYYHRFYAEQPNLDWNNAEVRDAMMEVLAFWVDRGVDGFRLDALDGLAVDPRLRDEPPAGPKDLEGRENDSWAAYWSLDHVHTTNLPKVLDELGEITAAFPRTYFVVEADLPREQLKPYMALADSSFAFDFIRAPLDGVRLAGIIDGAGLDGNLAWALSNHDQPRLVSRWGRERAAVAAVLLLALPGWSFIYQGDEIGMIDGPGSAVAHDRSGRDSVRHPMQWSPAGGFTDGTPWLPLIDPAACNVEDQLGTAGSTLEHYRALIRLRRRLRGPVEVLRAEADLLSFRREDACVTLNLGDDVREIGDVGAPLYATRPWAGGGHLPPRSAVISATTTRT